MLFSYERLFFLLSFLSSLFLLSFLSPTFLLSFPVFHLHYFLFCINAMSNHFCQGPAAGLGIGHTDTSKADIP